MPLLTLEQLNKELRDEFNQWYEDAMRPNLRIVSERLGLGYATVKNFKNGTDVTYKNVYRITEFLEKQGVKFKERA